MNEFELKRKEKRLTAIADRVLDALAGNNLDDILTVISGIVCSTAEESGIPSELLLYEIVKRCKIMED